MSELSVPFKNKPRLTLVVSAGFALLLAVMPAGFKYSFSSAVSSMVYAPLFSLGASFNQLLSVKRENQELRERLLSSNLENQSLKEAAREAQRLKSLLGLPAPPSFSPLAAKVVGMEPTQPPTEITVNRGSREGVRRNLPAVSPYGLVGKVLDATPDAAVVQLLFDPGCRVAARNQRSRVLGIVKWKSGPCLSFENVALGNDVAPGDTIVSSGLGGIFPEGLLIGTVARVESDSAFSFKQIEINPAVRFSALDEIFILLPGRGETWPREW